MWTRFPVWKTLIALFLGVFGLLIVLRLREDRSVASLWRTLEDTPRHDTVFSEELVANLPDAARRYFLHAIEPGTRLANRLTWNYTGRIRPGPQLPWMKLSAEQILVKERGFVWKARATKGPMALSVTDHYLDCTGRMRISLFGLLPIISATGADLSRSAMARLLVEGIALPSSFLPSSTVQIEEVDSSSFKVLVELHGEKTPVTISVDANGRPLEMVLPRWGSVRNTNLGSLTGLSVA